MTFSPFPLHPSWASIFFIFKMGIIPSLKVKNRKPQAPRLWFPHVSPALSRRPAQRSPQWIFGEGPRRRFYPSHQRALPEAAFPLPPFTQKLFGGAASPCEVVFVFQMHSGSGRLFSNAWSAPPPQPPAPPFSMHCWDIIHCTPNHYPALRPSGGCECHPSRNLQIRCITLNTPTQAVY